MASRPTHHKVLGQWASPWEHVLPGHPAAAGQGDFVLPGRPAAAGQGDLVLPGPPQGGAATVDVLPGNHTPLPLVKLKPT